MIESHIIRLGTHAEKDYLLLARSWYDEVILNANLVEGTSGSTAVFLQQLASYNKPYTIDPYNFVFAFNPDVISSQTKSGETRLKRTFRRLREEYAIPEFHDTSERLTPQVFSPQTAIEKFSTAVTEYQLSRISKAISDSAAFLDLDEDDGTLQPCRVLAPYFDVSGELAWLDVNLRLLEFSQTLNPGKTWGVVCLDGLVLDNPVIVERVAQDYRNVDCSGYMIWVTDIHGPTVTESQIVGLRSLVRTLAGPGQDRPVINMYAGYFPSLLYQDGLTGISHGLGYGERRSLIPAVGGGMPPARYYLKPIHEGISIAEFRRLVDSGIQSPQEFQAIICNCTICRNFLGNSVSALTSAFSKTDRKPFGNSFRDYPTQEVYKLARFHFLSNRHDEIQNVNNAPDLNTLLDELDRAYTEFQSILDSDLGYLKRWKNALS